MVKNIINLFFKERKENCVKIVLFMLFYMKLTVVFRLTCDTKTVYSTALLFWLSLFPQDRLCNLIKIPLSLCSKPFMKEGQKISQMVNCPANILRLWLMLSFKLILYHRKALTHWTSSQNTSTIKNHICMSWLQSKKQKTTSRNIGEAFMFKYICEFTKT